MVKEWANAQVRIDPLNQGCIHGSLGASANSAVVNSLAGQRLCHGVITGLCFGDSRGLDCAQVGGYLVAQHFFQPQTEQVRGVPGIRPGYDVASAARRASGPAMARGAAIRQTGAYRDVRSYVSSAISNIGPLSFHFGELAWEELAAAPDRSKRIAVDYEHRRAGGVQVAAAGADLL